MPKHWYIAVVTNNTEKACRDRLHQLGYESYVPTQTEPHHYARRKTQIIERVLIPAIIFIHATEEERRFIVTFPFIKHFLTNKSLSRNRIGTNNHPFATLTDTEMTHLQTLLSQPQFTSSLQTIPPPLLPTYISHLSRLGA